MPTFRYDHKTQDMRASTPCGLCERPNALGMASIGDTAYCHVGPPPTCYEQAQIILHRRNQGLEGAIPADEFLAMLEDDDGR
ncbi:MAG: hypothetical protein R3324_17790 [Halobacteriales archaeon]|nr:hypothetical protein [Halobacteriales archaeon]